MKPETGKIIRVMGQLAAAVSESSEARRLFAAGKVATELKSIDDPPAWMGKEDFNYYKGLAQFFANDYDSAEKTLSQAGTGSICTAEAYLIRAKIISSQLKDGNADSLLPRIFECYSKIADIYPYCSLTEYVAVKQTEQAEKATSGNKRLLVLPVTKLGTRYKWQELRTIGNLYLKQDLPGEAANAYRISIQVRYQDEWLQAGVLTDWMSIAGCFERSGDMNLALRYYAKCLSLPIMAAQISDISKKIETVSGITEIKSPEPHADRQTLIKIGGIYLEMEMFDEAVKAYKLSEINGESAAVMIASAIEAKAGFLFKYRSERSPHTVLYGSTLTWDRIAKVFEEAKKTYAQAQPPVQASREGTARCEASIRRLKELGAQEPDAK